MPERCFRQSANMRGVIYDYIKPFRSDFIGDFRQKFLIRLTSLKHLNTLSGHKVLWQLDIDPNDETTAEVVAPRLEGAPLADPHPDKLNLLVDPRPDIRLLHL